MPRMPLSGVRISCETIARKRDLARLAASAWSRASASACSACDPVGDVAADALHFGAAAPLRTVTSRQAIQRAPSRGGDLLVVHARAVAEQRGGALLDHRQREGRADEVARARARPACRRRRWHR